MGWFESPAHVHMKEDKGHGYQIESQQFTLLYYLLHLFKTEK